MQIAGCAQMLGPEEKLTVNLVQCKLETMLEWLTVNIQRKEERRLCKGTGKCSN